MIRIALATAGVAATLLLGGCNLQEAICSSGQYPVLHVGGTGRACVADGRDPPTGYARYPSGQEPKHVDDDWDVYWRSHTLDAKGNVIDATA